MVYYLGWDVHAFCQFDKSSFQKEVIKKRVIGF